MESWGGAGTESDSYRTPKYLQVSHTALFLEPPVISNQEFQQNLKYVRYIKVF